MGVEDGVMDGGVVDSGSSSFDVGSSHEPSAGGDSRPSPLEPGGVRFEQVYGKMKDLENQVSRYRGLGDADELKRIREEHATWKKAIDNYKKQQSLTPDEKSEAQRTATIRKELLKHYPELSRINSVSEIEKQMREMRSSMQEREYKGTLDSHSKTFAKVLQDNRIDPKYQDKIERHMVELMDNDQKRAFLNGDFSVVETIFNQELKDGILSGLKSSPNLPRPPMRNTPGGTPPKSAPKVKDLKEAGDLAASRFLNL